MWNFWSTSEKANFPYEILEQVHGLESSSIWTLHKGKKKATNELVSIFRCEPSGTGRDDQLERAKSAVKRLKTLRHPNFLTFLDGHESDKSVFIVTENVVPVSQYLDGINSYTNDQKRLAISWGLFQVTKGLSFLVNDCNLNHNNIFSGSIFVNSAGSWKIAGLDYVTPVLEANYPNKNIPALDKYIPPDGGKGTKWSNDSYGLGCLIWEVFNGQLENKLNLRGPNKIPKSLVTHYQELMSQAPSRRPSPQDFLDKCRSTNGFMKNAFIDTMLFLDEIQIKDQNEKNRFFANLDTQMDSFPSDICKNRILPNLVTAFEYGNAGSAVLGPLFKIAKDLEDSEYQKKIVPCIVKLFASKDRATRAKLLQQAEFFVKHLSKNIVNEQVYPQISQGFIDSNSQIREHTVKSMLHFAPKLNYANLNENLLQHFGRIQARDEEGVIRTNTIVCLGKIACHLAPTVRQNVLIGAFLRSMRDPFSPARINGILALTATQSFYSLKDTSTKVMPALCHMTMDPEKSVRDQAFKALKGFVGKLEKVSEDPSIVEQMEANINSSGDQANDVLAASWASWAVSSLASKFVRSKSQQAPPSKDMDKKPEEETKPPVSGDEKLSQSKSRSSSNIHQHHASEDVCWDKMGSMDDPPTKPIALQRISVSESHAHEGDGWDEDNWSDPDFTDDPTPVLKPQTSSSTSNTNPKTSTSMSASTSASKASSSNGWDNEDIDDLLKGESWISTVADKPNENRSRASRTKPSTTINDLPPSGSNDASTARKPKKQGPLKLGAMKIS